MGQIYDFVANTSDGVFGVDRQQRIVLWNRAAESMLGYTCEEVLGKACYGIVRGRDPGGCAFCRRNCDAMRSAKRLHLPPTRGLAVTTKTGDEVWLNVSTMVVPSPVNSLSVLIHLFRETSRDHELARVTREFAAVVSASDKRQTPRLREMPAADTRVRLTRREREILRHLMTGSATDVIADRLYISHHTVRNHINNILGKLSVHSRLEAVTYSIKKGLL